jgi:hypothetical protein
LLKVSLSHDEQGTSLADQLAELEVVGNAAEASSADESNFLPSGDLLRLPDGSRNFSSLLVKIKEQRQVRVSHPVSPTALPVNPVSSRTAVPQLTGQFVHAARYRSLPASRFEAGYADPAVKTEQVSNL